MSDDKLNTELDALLSSADKPEGKAATAEKKIEQVRAETKKKERNLKADAKVEIAAPKAAEIAPIGQPTLTSEEMLKLREEAYLEVQKELRADLAKRFKDEEKSKLKRQALFANGKDAEGKDVVVITLDLAPNSPNITLDGRVFWHGMTYKFTPQQAAVIQEQVHRGWMHEGEIKGIDMNEMYGRRKVAARISPNM